MFIPLEKNVKYCQTATNSDNSPISERRAMLLEQQYSTLIAGKVTVIIGREKGRDLTQSYDKCP